MKHYYIGRLDGYHNRISGLQMQFLSILIGHYALNDHLAYLNQNAMGGRAGVHGLYLGE